MQEDYRQQRAGQADILSVLDEAASWLHAHGIDQWPGRFETAWVEQAIERGETWLVLAGGDIAATLTLDWSDPIWRDIPGTAGHLRRMAVRRWAAGLEGIVRGDHGELAWVSGTITGSEGWPDNAGRRSCVLIVQDKGRKMSTAGRSLEITESWL